MEDLNEKEPRVIRRINWIRLAILLSGIIFILINTFILIDRALLDSNKPDFKIEDGLMINYDYRKQKTIQDSILEMLNETNEQNKLLKEFFNVSESIENTKGIDSDEIFSLPNLNENSEFPLDLKSDLTSIKNDLDNFEKELSMLKRSLHPSEVDKILSIPRLQDEIRNINQNITDLESNIDAKIISINNSIKIRNEANEKYTNWILLTLIPLLLKFSYDFIKERNLFSNKSIPNQKEN